MTSLDQMTAPSTVTAHLVLRRGGQGPVGHERIALLQVIAARRSIAAAAKIVGLSYRGAWDAVQALNNLFDRPLVRTWVGGQQGGHAEVTEDGLALIAAFGAAQQDLTQAFAALDQPLVGERSAAWRMLFWSLSMKTGVHNALRGVVDQVADGAANAEVTLNINGQVPIVAVVARQSVEDLGLTPGRPAIALIKSNFVILARDDGGLRTSARNSLAGAVACVEHGALSDEVTLEIGAASPSPPPSPTRARRTSTSASAIASPR